MRCEESEEDEEEESQDQGECDDDEEESSKYSQDLANDGMGPLPELHDSDEEDLMALEGDIVIPEGKKVSEPMIDVDDNNGDV